MQAPRIFVAVLSKDGRVALNFAMSMLAMQATLARNGVAMSVATIDNCTIVGHGRNRLLGQFLASQATHILYIDDDMGWPADAVMRLLASGHHFVGCTALRKEGPPARFACRLSEPERRDGNGFVAAEGLGMCLTLLSRGCVESLVRRHENLAYACPDTGATLYNLFDTELHNGQLQGNDYVFSRRWLEMGGEIWIDPVPVLDHVGTYTWSAALAEMIGMPATAQAAE